ncbi:MAG TPA: acetyltransferase [Azospirillaceae bacterium]|nr:acetyltransferase [Azospirillaceae bacterium]
MIATRQSRPDDREALFRIWNDAVRATHDFLGEDDIAFFARLVREEYLPAADLTVAVDGQDRPVGFLGMTGAKIDALFVDPAWHGRGVGRALVEVARAAAPDLSVDVNEQNRGAVGFYARLGFRVAGRSPLDGTGRPFPLLHLVLEATQK